LAPAAGVTSADLTAINESGGTSPLQAALVVPEMQSLAKQQTVAVEEARRDSPEAVGARAASMTIFEGLSAARGARLAAETFPAVIDEPGGGPPALPAGESITGYPTDHAARVDLPDGKRGVIDSLAPLAVQTSRGTRVPVDLTLTDVGGAFEPSRPVSRVRIPARLGDGVFDSSGVSLTPVDQYGAPLGAAKGVIDGAVVFYGDSEEPQAGISDVDTVVKPDTLGFSEETILRSQRSPQRLFFRVGLPDGATMTKNGKGSGAVQVTKAGRVIARIPAPSAKDAEGTIVPTSISISGHVLVLSVPHAPGRYRLPIAVDPTVIDYSYTLPGNWKLSTNGKFCMEGVGVHNCAFGRFEPGQYGDLLYTTQGESKIEKFRGETGVTSFTGEIRVNTFMAIAHSAYEAGPVQLPTARGVHEVSVASPSNGNTALYEVIATASGELSFEAGVLHPEVTIGQEAPPHVSWDTTHEIVEGRSNALYGNRWASSKAGTWGFAADATDPGMGVMSGSWSSPNRENWNSVALASCNDLQCPASFVVAHSVVLGKTEQGLPEGEDTIEAHATDPVGLKASTGPATVKIDEAAPHNITLTGLPSTHEISDGQHFLLKASATDGTSPTPSSGVASIALTMDGQSLGSPQGKCSPGPCTASGEWTLSGEAYATGQYTLAVVATDNAGNVAKEEFQVTIHHAAGVAAGPGSVNPVTGELNLTATDVSLGAPDGGLTVSRGYRSRHVAQGTEGPLGPQWIMSLGAQQSLSRTLSGGMVLTGNSGEQAVFAPNGKGGFTSPAGDAGLTLTEEVVEKATKFVLSQNGAVTTFALPGGSTGSVWTPSVSEGAGGTNVTTFVYQLKNGVVEPTEELAPVAKGVSCGKAIKEVKEGKEQLKAGCRALVFEYDTKETTAKGEGPSEWGEVLGHLSKVVFVAWNPATKALAEPVVARYAYDKQGRLRAEWNPQITPELKTIYGYDAEGHVTALSAGGEQPALLEQGTIPGDAGTGRLLAVSRPAASTTSELKERMAQAAPVNTSAPTLSSTTPKVGVKISVASNGTWSGSPLAYSYQWQDCNSSGKECTAIPGAVNQAYYPVSGDEGHTLAAHVVALNATGAVTASSAATSTVGSGTPNTPLPEPPSVGSSSVVTLEYNVPLSGTGAPQQMGSSEVGKWGQADVPAEAMAMFPPDKPMGWPAKEYTRATVDYLDGRDRAVNTASPTGGISTTEYNLYNDVVRTLSSDNRATALAAGTKSSEVSNELDSESTYEEKGSEPGTELLSTLGPLHSVQLTNGTHAEARAHTVYSYNEGAPSEGGPYHLVTKMTQGAQIAGKEESDVRTTTTSYSGQNNLGWKLRRSTSVTTDPTGLNLTHSIFYESKTGNVTETRLPAAGAPGEEPGYLFQFQFGTKGKGNGQFEYPQGIAVTTTGVEYVLDTANNRVQKFKANGEFVEVVKISELKEPRGISLDSQGNLWIADTGNNCVKEYTPSGVKEAKIEGLNAPQGVAVNSEGVVWVANTGNSTINAYAKEVGKYVNVRTVGTKGPGPEQFSGPQGIAIGVEGNLYVSDTLNQRIDEYTAAAKYVRAFGAKGTGNGQLINPHGITTDSAGDVFVADVGNDRIDEFTSTGVFVGMFGDKNQVEGELGSGPKDVAIDPEGDAWVADFGNNRVQEYVPNGGYGSGTATAHDSQTIYYTSGPNLKVTTCGEHPEWANLPCQTQPAAQPEGSLPKLQVTTYTYNMWDEPETTTNTSGTTTRTTTQSYDAAGRLKSTATSSTVGTALPTVNYEYNTESGALVKESTTSEGKTKAITSTFNTLGQLTAYTDVDENTSAYEYDVDGRIHKANNGRGTESFTYSTTTGLPGELVNEYGATKLTFTATYDPEGNMLSEGYPNGMSANYTYNTVGKPTFLEYKKTTHCTEENEKCKWFTDSVTPSIHGQWLSQTSTFSKQAYAYDQAGRLIQTQNTPAGKGCTTRIYAYDADTNRTSLTTRAPNSKEECATEGGAEEKHTYDTADRLTDAGTTYNTFGNITTLSATDAGGKEPSEALTSTYYVDNQLASQTQNGQTIGYNLDPAGRTRETVSTGNKASDIVSHYAGPQSAPAWTANTSSETTRNIPGIGGTLAAVQNNSESPVLQLANLHGDLIATAYLSETATELASKTDTSEFGVPTTSLPAKYSWLGAMEIPTELPSGVIAMGARSYVPQIARFLQPDPVQGGSANAYTYTFGDPVNSSDPSGASTILELIAGHAASVGAPYKAKEEAERAALRALSEAQARAQAEGDAQDAKWAAYWAAGPHYFGEGEEWGEEEWYEEEWEEEGEYEWASYHHGGEGNEEAHIEPAVLYQPLTDDVTNDDSGANGPEGWSRIEIKGGPRHGCAKRKRCHRGGSRRGENQEVCEFAGGAIGGIVGSPGGLVGSTAGAAAGTVAGKELCKE
jgi:RHS repeat-associated protein